VTEIVMTHRKRYGRHAATLAVATALAFIGGSSAAATDDPAQYVALGSSFAAAPGVGTRAQESPPACGQSSENYAHLLARKRHLRLIDRSCSGSISADILHDSKAAPAQIDAVNAATELVTITTGGNDVAYIGNLYAWSCARRPEAMTPSYRLVLCREVPPATVGERLKHLDAPLKAVVAAVRTRAPRARIILIDYAAILPRSGGCPDRVPLSMDEFTRGRAVAKALALTTARVAKETGATLIGASKLTEEHDVCASAPWVAGWTFPGSPQEFAPIAYHPSASAMKAIASALDAALSRP
jgi:hypothetical protein